MAQNELGMFDGSLVLSTSIKVTNAGDGLSAAMAVDPVVMHLGEKRYVVLECEVVDVTFREIPDTGGAVTRVHRLKAGDAAIVAPDLVADALAAQRQRILEAQGVQEFDFGEPDDQPDPAPIDATSTEA